MLWKIISVSHPAVCQTFHVKREQHFPILSTFSTESMFLLNVQLFLWQHLPNDHPLSVFLNISRLRHISEMNHKKFAETQSLTWRQMLGCSHVFEHVFAFLGFKKGCLWPRGKASCYRKDAGSIPLVCMSKCPWARYWTPNCSWCAGWHLALQPPPSGYECMNELL